MTTCTGNELADRLAEEEAKEAETKKETSSITTLEDVTMAAKMSVKKKLQDRWEHSERGRFLFQYRPTVTYKLKGISFQSFNSKRRISQLRLGYAPLNEYMQKCGLKDSNKCAACGEIESISHYLLTCPEFETEREQLCRRLFEAAGLIHLDLEILLNARPDDDYKEYRGFILKELETFITQSGRFTSKTPN